jgi:hypothetical protein
MYMFNCSCLCCTQRAGVPRYSPMINITSHNLGNVNSTALIPHPLLFGQDVSVRALSTPQWLSFDITYRTTVPLVLLGLPGFCLSLQQFDLFGPLDTGAVLWPCEVLAAELLPALFSPKLVRRATSLDSSLSQYQCRRARLVELGCGTSPVCGMFASALGFDVFLTDVAEVLQGARQNLVMNSLMMNSWNSSPCRLETLAWGPSAREDLRTLWARERTISG